MRFFYSRSWLVLSVFFLKALTGPTISMGQTPIGADAADIFLQLKKLKVLGAVLYVAAHPDDENTRLLAWLSKERLYRTGYLSLTRGDGGQNLIGNEQGIRLGMIRTQELLAARRIDGAEQFFSRAYDFGFSKSTAEALRIWDKESILSDVVWVIRKFRPDVIITRFPEDSRAGHGHHSGSAVLAHEAFFAAADPTRFPEQLKQGVAPWKAKRIVWNTFNFGNTNTTSNDQLKLDVGNYNALLGKSYGEIAAESRSQHKSQGFGVPAARGVQLEYFSPVEGEAAASDLMDGVNTNWTKVEGGAVIEKKIDSILQAYSLANPERSVPALVQLYDQLNNLRDAYWKTQKQQEVQRLIALCSGLWLEATTNAELAVQGDSIRVNWTLNNRLGTNITVNKLSIDARDTSLQKKLETNRNFQLSWIMYVDTAKPISQPYWLREQMGEGSFTVKDQQLIGKPENGPAYEANFELIIEGQPFTFKRPVQYKFTDPVKGELYRPLVIMPAATLSLAPDIVLFKQQENKSIDLTIKVTAQKDLKDYKARVWKHLDVKSNNIEDTAFSLAKGMSKEYPFTVAKPAGAEKFARVFVNLKNGKEEQPAYLNLTHIQYDHIPPIHYFFQDATKLMNIDLKTVGKRIGYIDGAGDQVPHALELMGYQVTMLKESDINPLVLRQYDAVITGVRAYNVHAYLSEKYNALMEYVKQGGNLIVQYNTNSNIGALRARLGPYAFNISRARITDEKSPVRFLLPNHPVLNYPNKITSTDFNGWVQERGIYFAEQVDKNYQMPLSMADPDEPEHTGSLLIGNYGKGTFVYTGLVFFRELPGGVAGAYRLMANIIALNKKQPSK